jgi:hypothetical protein
MKFLLALTVLATTSVFAQPDNGHGRDKIKCYESAQQNGYGKPAFVFEVERRGPPTLNGQISLVYPDQIRLEREHGCLETDWNPSSTNTPERKFRACPGEGQEIGRLVPVEIDYQEEEDTYYCERELTRYLGDHDDLK